MPKSMYRTAEELENEDVRLWTETIYQSASVFKGAPHEVRPRTGHVTACSSGFTGNVGQAASCSWWELCHLVVTRRSL